MRCCLCVKLQPCEILPGLQEAYYPETDCRAYAEKTCPYYAIEKKTACFTGRSGGVSCMGKGLIPNPVKMGFYCVTYNQNCTYKKTGRGGYSLAAVSRLFLFSYPRSVPFSRSGSLSCRKMLSIFCLITSYSLTCFFSFP